LAQKNRGLGQNSPVWFNVGFEDADAFIPGKDKPIFD
jgi:hypothetical protein